MRAQLLGNISLSYKQLGDHANVITYATMVLDEVAHLREHPDLLIKVLLRRGMSYESVDKCVEAKVDFMSIKLIDPGNL